MDKSRGLLVGLMAGVFLFGSTVNAQDSQSLGDVARRQRQQNEQSTQGKDPKVITNEEIPEHPEAETTPIRKNGDSPLPPSKTPKQSADFWRSRIHTEKSQITYLQRKIDEVNASIRFSSVSCARCVIRNERQVAKEQRVEQMRSELDQNKKHLEQMQDAARRQGYGSSVYDP